MTGQKETNITKSKTSLDKDSLIESDSLNIKNDGGLMYITFPSFERTGGVTALFTTRMGGVSRGRYASMNMSFSNGDDRENVLKNFKILCRSAGLDYRRLVFSHQTHTVNLRCVTEDDAGKGIVKTRDYEDIDGLLTNVRGIGLVTQFADCVPLLFYDPVKSVVAASHAGWRGTFGEIGRLIVEKMVEQYGCRTENILAAIAPSICKNCYEVDEPLYKAAAGIPYLPLDEVIKKKEDGKYMLDLWECNRRILIHAGILPKNITVTDLCTNCNSHIFHSHRATKGQRGNLAAIIALK